MFITGNVLSGAGLKGERRSRVFRSLIFSAAVFAGTLALAGCGSGSDDVVDRPAVGVSAPAQAAMMVSTDADDSVTTHIVEIKQFQFIPEVLTVKKGDRVIWRNLDVVPHTATENDNRWDSGNLNQNDAWTLVAEAVGENEYICTYHPVMKGKLIVVEQ